MLTHCLLVYIQKLPVNLCQFQLLLYNYSTGFGTGLASGNAVVAGKPFGTNFSLFSAFVLIPLCPDFPLRILSISRDLYICSFCKEDICIGSLLFSIE